MFVRSNFVKIVYIIFGCRFLFDRDCAEYKAFTARVAQLEEEAGLG